MGRKHTEESKEKMRQIALEKGNRPPPGSPRTVPGYKQSEETKAKMRKAHAERVITPEEREAKSEVVKRLWARRRDEVRRKMRKPNTLEHNAKIRASWTPERRAKQSVISSQRIADGVILSRDTSIELFVEGVLAGSSVDYEKQHLFVGHVWDFAIIPLKLLIEADGCYWHGCRLCGFEGKSPHDRLNDEQAESSGWTVLRIPEHAINKMPKMVVSRIKVVCGVV